MYDSIDNKMNKKEDKLRNLNAEFAKAYAKLKSLEVELDSLEVELKEGSNNPYGFHLELSILGKQLEKYHSDLQIDFGNLDADLKIKLKLEVKIKELDKITKGLKVKFKKLDAIDNQLNKKKDEPRVQKVHPGYKKLGFELEDMIKELKAESLGEELKRRNHQKDKDASKADLGADAKDQDQINDYRFNSNMGGSIF